MSDYILGGQVEILPDHEGGSCVLLHAGPYKGVKLRYGRVAFKGDSDGLDFNYEILDSAGHKGLKSKKFIRQIGDLLSYLMVSTYTDVRDTSWADFSLED